MPYRTKRAALGGASASKKSRPSDVYRARVSRGLPRTSAGSASELKVFDTAINFNIDATGEVPATGQLNLIPQGTSESTRIGRKVVVKSIQINGHLLCNPGAGNTPSEINYIWLVLDKQCNGAAASAADVLTGTAFQTALPNVDNSQRFVILRKFVIQTESKAGVATAWALSCRPWTFYKKVNIPIDFSSTTGAITEIRSNNLFLLAGTNQTGDDLTNVTATCRLRFTDN